MSSGAVSPMTRATARIDPETMPGSAVRNTTLVMVRCLVTPSASEASRNSFGTILSISSEDLHTVGSMSSASATDPSNPLNVPGPHTIAKSESAKRPATIDGMPLMTSTSRRIVLASRPSFAYSMRYTAHMTPMGMEMTIAPSVISNVPRIACSTPP